MIQLTNEEKQIINNVLKPLLKKDDWDKIRQECTRYPNILGFFAENKLPVFEGLTKIPNEMFAHSTLSSIVIPGYIKTIGTGAFYDCANLSSVVFEDGIETIDAGAFRNSGIVQADLPASLEKLDSRVFADCQSLKSVVIPDSITVLPYKLFENCNDVEIYAHSRKNLPRKEWLKCSKEETDWYAKHLKVLAELA